MNAEVSTVLALPPCTTKRKSFTFVKALLMAAPPVPIVSWVLFSATFLPPVDSSMVLMPADPITCVA